MGIAKEIFGIDKYDTEHIPVQMYPAMVRCEKVGFNSAIDQIDAFEISEEAIENVVWELDIPLAEYEVKIFAKAIKANANKIFVRKS